MKRKWVMSILHFSICLVFFANGLYAQTEEEDNLAGFKSFLPSWEKAVTAFVNGDNTLWKQICSQSNDATILGGFGGYEKGWEQVNPRYDWAAAQFKKSGTEVSVEYINMVVSYDLAYIVVIERCNPLVGDRKTPVSQALRATQIFRKENNTWKLLHRHADILMDKKAP